MVSSVGERASTSSEATETDDENTSQGLKQRKRHGGVPAAEQQEPTHATLHHRPTTRARARRGAITLKYLIDKGVLEPGKDVLSLVRESVLGAARQHVHGVACLLCGTLSEDTLVLLFSGLQGPAATRQSRKRWANPCYSWGQYLRL